MYNELYNTPLSVEVSTCWFSGTERCPGMGRTEIVTASGVLYSGHNVGEDRHHILKSTDNGFTWTTVTILANLSHSEGFNGVGGIAIWIDYSEIDDVLYAIYMVESAGKYVPYLYDCTNSTGIGLIGSGIFNCEDRKFAAAGHIDRKVCIAWVDADDASELKGTLIDINHWAAGVRTMTITAADGGQRTTGSSPYTIVNDDTVGTWDVSEVDGGFHLWWIAASTGYLMEAKLTLSTTAESMSINANTTIHQPGGTEYITELAATETSCLFALLDNTPGNSTLQHALSDGTVTAVTLVNGANALAEDAPGGLDRYCLPQLLFINDDGVDKMQLFWVGRNSGGDGNQIETVDIIISTGVQGTPVVVTGGLAAPWNLRDRAFAMFEPPNRTQGEIGGRGGYLVAIGNGDAIGFGHRPNNCSVYTVRLANNAYPLTIASTVISSTVANYYSADDISRHAALAERAFARHGVPLVVLQYEVGTDPQVKGLISYLSPVEIELNGFINDLSLKNPTNIRLQDSEIFNDVLEKDIRTLYYPASIYLSRTFTRARRGFILRTVYLLAYFSRFYEITQIVPVFGKNGIVAHKANLYVVGASYDPFTRHILPNEI